MCWPAPRLLARAARGIPACAAAPPRSGLSVMRQIQDILFGRGRVPDRPCRDGPGPSGGMTLARQLKRGPRTALWHRARRSPPIRRAPPPGGRALHAGHFATHRYGPWRLRRSIITKILWRRGFGKADDAVGTGTAVAPARAGVRRPRISVDDCGAIAEARCKTCRNGRSPAALDYRAAERRIPTPGAGDQKPGDSR